MAEFQTSMNLLGQLRQQSDQQAWERFATIYGPLVFGWLKRRGVREDVAEDVRQEVLLKVFHEIKGFDHNGRIGAFRAWLHQVMLHRLRTIQRQNIRSRLTDSSDEANEDAAMADSGDRLAELWEAEHSRFLIERLIEMIAPEFQERTLQAFRRVVLNDEPIEAVAQELEMSVNAARIAQSRVLSALRREGAGLIEY